MERYVALGEGASISPLPGAYECFYRQLAEAIAGRGPVPVTAESAGQVIQVIEAALRSAEEGRRITLGRPSRM